MAKRKRTSSQKVAGWYWITSAILTPFILIACILTGVFAYQSQSYRNESDRILASLKKNNETFDHLSDTMRALGEQTGFVLAKPDATVDKYVATDKPAAGMADEEQKPQTDRNPVYLKWREAEDLFRGNGKQIQNYKSAREYLDGFEKQITRYLAYKAYQYYDVKTINIGNLPVGAQPAGPQPSGPQPSGPQPAGPQPTPPDRVVVAENVIERPGRTREIDHDRGLTSSAYMPEDPDLDRAFDKWKAGDQPNEFSLKKPTVVTLELIYRKQMHLLDELVNADVRQYGLLIAEVTSNTTGYGGADQRASELATRISNLGSTIDQRKTDSVGKMGEVSDADGKAEGEAGQRKTGFEGTALIRSNTLNEDAAKFEAEKDMHTSDANQYRELAKKIPRIKAPKTVPNSEPDGMVTYSDYKRGTIHINLGTSNHVIAGQRFEVLRTSGREKDMRIGVIEIVRTLSPYYSLCTVINLDDPSQPVRKDDAIYSPLWHKDHFLTVVLAGAFNPPDQAYSKERYTELLKKAGCRVVDKLQPGTDLVITGNARDLTQDDWYKTARNDIMVDTITEEQIRLYFAPR